MSGFVYTNKHDISLAMAVFLMADDYDYDHRDNVISATTLLKPLRQIVLARQNKDLLKTVDISDLVASRMGSAIHVACEQAWTDKNNVAAALKVLGAGPSAIERVAINPEVHEPGMIPVYVEQRHEKEINNYIITGKYDLVLDGTLNDYKSTSVWTYIYDSNSDNYTLQGSIYKWLAPDRITSDYININYIFTDWSAAKAKQDSSYPQQRVLTKKYPLMSVEETEQWIAKKVDMINSLMGTTQDLLPYCTDEELWASETVYKYYKKPDATRATKNFDNLADANALLAANGCGVVKTVPGEVKACRYCKVVGICTQAEELLAAGRLFL